MIIRFFKLSINAMLQFLCIGGSDSRHQKQARLRFASPRHHIYLFFRMCSF